jgi:hypothetical protein
MNGGVFRPPDTPRAGTRRCLGPGKEHTFYSPDCKRFCVCVRCQKKIYDAPVSVRETMSGVERE